jgi:hypothetical protein
MYTPSYGDKQREKQQKKKSEAPPEQQPDTKPAESERKEAPLPAKKNKRKDKNVA